MTSDEYWYVFDVSRQPFQAWGLLIPFALFCVGVGGVFLGDRRVTRVFCFVFAIANAAMSGAMGWDLWKSYQHYQAAFRHGDYAVIEGIAQEFRPDNASGSHRVAKH